MSARRVVRIIGRVVAGLLLTAIIAVFVILGTGPGHRFLRARVLAALTKAIDGQVHLGSLDGPIWRAVNLNTIELTTRDGKAAIRAEKLSVSFSLLDILRGRYVFSSVTLIRPVIELDQDTSGRWNIERLFRVGRDTSARAGRRPLVVLHDVTIQQGTLIIRARGAGDTVITRSIQALSTDLARLRVSHPDSSALEAGVRRLVATIDQPHLDLRNAAGTLVLDGDSLRFDLDNVTLPGTQATLAGQMRWGGEHLVLHAALDAKPLAFADVRGLVATLPEEGGGEIAVIAAMLADGTISADVRQADLRSGRSAVRGRGAFSVRPGGSGTLRDVNLALQPLDLALIEPYVDSLPLRGLVRGRVQGDGALRNLAFDAVVDWTDEATAGRPVNTLDARGRLILGGPQGVGFRAVQLRRADADFASIGRFAPSVRLVGRLRARGTLEGPWRAAQFRGVLDHSADSGQATAVHGDVKLGIGGVLRVDAELDVDSLSMNLLRRSYPAIPVTGMLRGRVVAHGPLDSLAADAVLVGSAGRVAAQGIIAVRDGQVTLALGGSFDSLNLHAMTETQPASELAGSWRVDLVVPTDSTLAATGAIHADLTGVTVGSVALGPGRVVVTLVPDAIRVDTMTLAFDGGGLEATGSIGRGPGATGTLNFQAHADTIGYLEPLVRFFATATDDSTGVVRLDGKGTLNGSIAGTTTAWTMTADLAVDAVNVSGNFGRAIKASGSVTRDGRGMTLALRGSADTVSVGTLGYRPVQVELAGRLDSLTLTASAGFLNRSTLRARVTTWSDSTLRTLVVDSLELKLPVHTWNLSAPVTAQIRPGTMTMDSLDFRSDGTGYLIAVGTFSRQGASDFTLAADSIPLEDLYAAAQRDTTGVKGAFSTDAKVVGPAGAPAIELSAALADARMGEYSLPMIQVEGTYGSHQLAITGGLWRDSVRIVSVTGTLPIDLSLQAVSNRLLDGPISIAARADTLDMQVFNAFTTSIAGASGRMALDLRAGGTWGAPFFSGFMDISGGTVQVPAIGADYSGIELRFESPGDSVWYVRRGQVRAGGTLDISGQIGFKDLIHPGLEMDLRASRFSAFDIRSFGAITATGQLELRGPLIGATLTGAVVVDQGALQFANLVEKRIVSLDDPEFRAMVDSNLAGADLAPAGHQIFFDSLRIANLSLEMGPDVWLRSSEANIQLDGAIQVQRRFEDNLARYRIDGTLRALRGNYRLAIGLENSPIAVTRDFRVTRGTVRFFGTPDMNPEMDVAAEYVTRTVNREPLTVRAIIEGTLLYPRLRLESDSRLPLTESEIASYLMFGSPSPDLGFGGASNQLLVMAGGALGGLGQAFASELGLPINYLTITPGGSSPTTAAGGQGTSNTRIEAGLQIGNRTFLTLNAGLCEIREKRAVGVALEYRMSDSWSVASAFEPVVQTCGTAAAFSQLKQLYQLGLDLFWQSGIR